MNSTFTISTVARLRAAGPVSGGDALPLCAYCP